jgi:hypothetical protein
LTRAFGSPRRLLGFYNGVKDHRRSSSMVMVWYASCMAPSASSRFPLPVSAPPFVSFRFVALHGCSVCSPSSDTLNTTLVMQPQVPLLSTEATTAHTTPTHIAPTTIHHLGNLTSHSTPTNLPTMNHHPSHLTSWYYPPLHLDVRVGIDAWDSHPSPFARWACVWRPTLRLGEPNARALLRPDLGNEPVACLAPSGC